MVKNPGASTECTIRSIVWVCDAVCIVVLSDAIELRLLVCTSGSSRALHVSFVRLRSCIAYNDAGSLRWTSSLSLNVEVDS